MSYLFSPGPVPQEFDIDVSFSHRGKHFETLYKTLRENALNLLPECVYNDVLFTQGSASSAIETVLSSVLSTEKDYSSRLLILSNGSFGKRALEMVKHYCHYYTVVSSIEEAEKELKVNFYTHFFAVQFETSLSIYNNVEPLLSICKSKNVVSIVDAVSGFPYYSYKEFFPDFLITSSAKQLLGIPVMGLIFYNTDNKVELVERSDYLSLKKYIEYSKKNQTPHTSLIPQMVSLDRSLEKFFYSDSCLKRNKIKIQCNSIALTDELADVVVNEAVAPVITIKVKNTEEVVFRLNCFGMYVYYNLFYMKDYIQVGMFNYDTIQPYSQLNKYLLDFREEGLI